jgi:phage internal scaffolding protein
MSYPKIRKPLARERVSKSFLDVDGKPLASRTQQQFKDDVDINNVLRQYDKHGLITHVNTAKAEYGDFTEVNEYQEAINTVRDAEGRFMEMPSNIRAFFDNDPGAFVEFVTNPDNADKLVEMGLATKILDENRLRILEPSEQPKDDAPVKPAD